MFWLDENKINETLHKTFAPSDAQVQKILEIAEKKKGLDLESTAILLNITENNQLDLLFKSAGKIKEEIYGNRLVLFAPLYISDHCINDCEYCGFQCRNKSLDRKRLSQEEIKQQTETIIKMGHKRILLETGEHPENSIDYVCDAIKTIYNTKVNNGEIRRVNVNVAATTAEDYKKLKEVGIGTYQLFQETYNRNIYTMLHTGPKADYERQLHAHERALQAGIDDYGMGVLFGLYDYKFEVLSLLSHAKYLDQKYNVGPHTISVPRFQSANSVLYNARFPVSDEEFLKLIAILRVAVPYAGLIISTREPPDLRSKAFQIGISQSSAASRTSPGGYQSTRISFKQSTGQFSLSDTRTVEETIADVSKYGILPSFCTACYRNNRTGDRFMQLAKTGKIHHLCRPNAILTFKEYLEDYAQQETKKLGQELIEKELERIDDSNRKSETQNRLKRIEKGERDLYF